MPKCNKCGKNIVTERRLDGLPNGVGLELEDGKTIYICTGCVLKLGELPEDEREEFIDSIAAE